MSSNIPSFDFKNWDFMDPKIISKFKAIADVSQMLQGQQNQLKNVEFVSFKDKQKIQNNINKFKSNLQNLVDEQKENLINYFDKQLNFVSKRSAVSGTARTFQQSLQIQQSSSVVGQRGSRRKRGRRYSEGDLSEYVKEKAAKDRVLQEIRHHEMESVQNSEPFNASIITGRSSYREKSGFIDEMRGSVLNMRDIDSHQGMRSTKKEEDIRKRTNSIFSQWEQENETQAESQFFGRKLNELQEDLDRKKRQMVVYRKYYKRYRRLTKNKKLTRGRAIQGKDFVRDSKRRRACIEIVKVKENTSDKDREIEKLRAELRKEKEKNEMITKGVKELSHIVIRNEEMMEQMVKNKRIIEIELKTAKELNSVLVGNFSQFKGYVEDMLSGVSKKLASYVQKEEFYSEIVKENEQLKQKCKALLIKLKEVTHC